VCEKACPSVDVTAANGFEAQRLDSVEKLLPRLKLIDIRRRRPALIVSSDARIIFQTKSLEFLLRILEGDATNFTRYVPTRDGLPSMVLKILRQITGAACRRQRLSRSQLARPCICDRLHCWMQGELVQTVVFSVLTPLYCQTFVR
jgi:hypothetical protein